MTAAEDSPAAEDVRRLTVAQVLEAVAMPQPSSGAGIGAALSLALACACGRKAIGVTLRKTEQAELPAVDEQLALLQHRAVAHAQRDELLFRAYLESKQPIEAQHLVESSQLFQQLVLDVGKALEELRGSVSSNVTGDLDAAAALHRAAREIAAGLMREARAERSRRIR